MTTKKITLNELRKLVRQIINEERSYSFQDVTKNKHVDDRQPSNTANDFKNGQYAIGSKFFGSAEEVKEQMFIVTGVSGNYVLGKKVSNGSEIERPVQDVIIISGMG
jgi:hypothetical protein